MRRTWIITAYVFEATDAEADAMFNRVVDAAHERDEQVTCSMALADES